MSVQAVPTRYKGCHFRSRLEARWAVFFDALKINWEYEPQTYKIGFPDQSRYYLPDFYLYESETWVEVKGNPAMLDWAEMACAVDGVYMLPLMRDSLGSTRGLLVLGGIPDLTGAWPAHPLLQHESGGRVSWAVFRQGGLEAMTAGRDLSTVFESCQDWDGWKTLIRERLDGSWGLESPSLPAVVRDAYYAARSARFEHGEFGAS